jgi:hypothetical protein
MGAGELDGDAAGDGPVTMGEPHDRIAKATITAQGRRGGRSTEDPTVAPDGEFSPEARLIGARPPTETRNVVENAPSPVRSERRSCNDRSHASVFARMTTVISILGFTGRAIGRVLSRSLGWASGLLYGKVPKDHQVYVELMLGASIVWAFIGIAVLIPAIGGFLWSTTPFAPSIGLSVVRGLIVAALILLPAVVGLAGVKVPADGQRPKGVQMLLQILRGYPIAVLIAALAILVPAAGTARRIGSVRRGWSDSNIPIVVNPGGYEQTVTDVEKALAEAGMSMERHDAPRLLALPGKLLALVAGKDVQDVVPDRLIELRRPDLEVGVYPSDIAISGAVPARTHARMTVMTSLATTEAHFTTSAESQKIEDRLARISDGSLAAAEAKDELKRVDDALASLDVGSEDWDILFRLRLQAERDLLRR